MNTGLEFIPATLMAAIVGWFGFGMLFGSLQFFKEKKILAGVCAIVPGIILSAAVVLVISEVFLAWLFVAAIALPIIIYLSLSEDKRYILKSIFGWICILFTLYAFWLAFTE